MHIEIISPDKSFFKGEIKSVTVPGRKGEFQVLNDHAPIISTMGAGQVTVNTGSDVLLFDITGGVIEVLKNRIILLIEGTDNGS
ncbi:MAG: F0F1 ATP synthase subunit epsilon [Bacteroidales bacterium]|nr:F0F1 ATP synthase subunit epsilon [Bacteroidales bacterium]